MSGNLSDDNEEGADLKLSDFAKGELNQTRKWTMFLAIIGFIGSGFMAITGFITAVFASGFSDAPIGLIGLVYVVLAVVLIFPNLYLVKFSNAAKRAVSMNENFEADTAFNNMKKYFKYFGILVIVLFGLNILFFIGGMATGMMAFIGSEF